jgi:hypothetical protein
LKSTLGTTNMNWHRHHHNNMKGGTQVVHLNVTGNKVNWKPRRAPVAELGLQQWSEFCSRERKRKLSATLETWA